MPVAFLTHPAATILSGNRSGLETTGLESGLFAGGKPVEPGPLAGNDQASCGGATVKTFGTL